MYKIIKFIINLFDLASRLKHRSLTAVAYQRVLHNSQDFHTVKPYISSKRLRVDTTLDHKTHCTVIFCSDLRQSLNADVKFTRTMAVAITPVRWTVPLWRNWAGNPKVKLLKMNLIGKALLTMRDNSQNK